MNQQIIDRVKKKAMQSTCRYKIGAVGFDKKGKTVVYVNNRSRFVKYGGGIHAEMRIMANYSVSSILIIRISKTGNLLPIHPCKVCAKKAKELNIKIITIK